jgi:hypothetical protein
MGRDMADANRARHRRRNLKALIIGGIAALTVGLAACGGATTTNPGSTNLTFKVAGDTIVPDTAKAVKGQQVTMTITTDKDEEVHLHGYDIHFDCKANTPLTKTFTADKTGSFEMELEATTKHLLDFTVNPS